MNPLETYFKDLRDIRATGAAVAETSFYPVLSNLFNEIGKTLRPKVRCVINPASAGAGLPDGGLFTADQFQRASDSAPKPGQLPARGVVEVKGPAEDVLKIAAREQVKRYVARYGLALVTNYRDFLLLGQGPQGAAGDPVPIERYTLAESEAAFWQAARHPEKTAKLDRGRFCEYLARVMLSNAPLSAPQDLAWFLASYARDAKARVEAAVELPALAAVRDALEEALGMKFTGDKGEHFFRSTLVQTIFYGVFSAWVLWHREQCGQQCGLAALGWAGCGTAEGGCATFDWHTSAWSLRVPFIRALYDEIATPSKLGPLGLVEVLDWTAAALNRVDRAAFFQRFQDEHAVQYFYEPFLEAFDPALRKELGVWLTPPEIVKYQVARVDTVLREELGLPDGLADPNVIVLDPCCGTGAYLVEVLKRIAETLKAKGGDALIASDLKKAAMTRVFGFEILPAPFVVAHLQLGLLLHSLGAPLSNVAQPHVAQPPSAGHGRSTAGGGRATSQTPERVGVYLTNSLTGWEPPKEPKKLLFPELAAERDAAGHVKRQDRVLVILGNPPYNGVAGMAVDEERELSTAYRTTKKAAPPQGQGLNDLYIRFFRMAERRIVEMNKPGKGVVCFISNYSWLDGLSFTGMRERYLEAFDRIWIDCLNGDKYKTGKLTPEGQPDPSVFSTESSREGIQVGTAIALLVRSEKNEPAQAVSFRHFWGANKRAELAEASGQENQEGYEPVEPVLEMGLPFRPASAGCDYFTWAPLSALYPVSFPGVKTSRDDFVTDIDRDKLIERMGKYFDPRITHDEMRAAFPSSVAEKDGERIRDFLRNRGFLGQYVVRFAYRPFDTRWLYWEPEAKLLDRGRAEYFPHVFPGNLALTAR